MPKSAEAKAARQGGISAYRMIRKKGKLFRCMITRKPGPKKGRTVCYPVKK